MPGMFDQWDEKRTRAERPAPPSAPPTIVDPGRASAYALAALQGEVENLLAVPVGHGRNDQLNKSALKMYGYAEAGAISHDLVTETLGAADGGLDFTATRKTLASAREAASRYGARAIPESTPTTTREVPPWETPSSDPFDDNYVPASSPRSSATPSPGVDSPVDATGTSGHGKVAALDSGAAGTAGSELSTSETTASSPSDPLLVLEVDKVRRAREARRFLDHEDAVAAFRVPPSRAHLADELLIIDAPVTYRIDDVFPTGANVLLTAQYKAGKTTLVDHFAKALVDGVPFLGRYDVHSVDGRVGLFNYEVGEDQYRRWLREVGFENQERVAPLNLRGYRLPLTERFVEDWVVAWLVEHEVQVWVVDPFARAFTGSGDENSNGDVGAWLDTLDVIKNRAGVAELVLPNHTGRAQFEAGQERSRGATRLDDWADVRWLLTKDDADVRYFRASGRDVETPEGRLDYEPASRALTLVDGSRVAEKADRVRIAVHSVVDLFPGLTGDEVEAKVRDAMRDRHSERVSTAAVRAALRHLCDERFIEKVDGESSGGRPPKVYRKVRDITEHLTSPPVSSDPFDTA